MRLDLKPYTNPVEYPEIFDHNFRQIDAIQDDPFFSDFVTELSKTSGVSYNVVLIDVKRYIMHSFEYSPEKLRRKVQNIFLLPAFCVYLLAHISLKKADKSEVLIDNFHPDLLSTLYGEELVSSVKRRYNCICAPFTGFGGISPGDFLRSLPYIVKCFFKCKVISKEHGVDLRNYLCLFFFHYLTGLKLKGIGLKLVISGNDNGFPVIKARSAGIKIILIQNGSRSLLSDSSFCYCDHYVSMCEEKLISCRRLTGCVFLNVHMFGSIRMYNFLKSIKDTTDIEPIYDILFVDAWSLMNGDDLNYTCFERYYSINAEIKLIKLVNEIASKGLKVAYHCREDDLKIKQLRRLGIFSENVHYIKKSDESVYSAVLRSKIILSCNSTVDLEAMALGRKVCFANLSGNRYINYPYKDLDIEYTPERGISLFDYIGRIEKQDKDYSGYIRQNPRYVDDLLSIIEQEVRQ